LSVWVKRTGSATGTVVARYTGANASSSFSIISLSATTVALVVLSGTAQKVSGNLTLTLNTWHLLTFRKAAGASVATLHRDDLAAVVSPASAGQINSGSSLSFRVGSNSTPGQYAGNMVIDELYYFPDELKDDDWVTAMYNAGAGRSYPD
jgi:hypothetical protein